MNPVAQLSSPATTSPTASPTTGVRTNHELVAEYDQSLIHRNLYELFATQADRHGDKVAVIAPDASLTYKQLDERALAVSAFLRAAGVQPDQPVGVFMKRNADVIAVLLGILHAGGCYVPLDPAEPVERARVLTTSAKIELVLCDAVMLGQLQQTIDAAADAAVPGHRIDLVDVAPIIAAAGTSPGGTSSDSAPCAEGGPRLAYIMFTSGSTGVPKAVEVEHRNAINLMLAAAQAFEFTEDDRYLAVSTLAFDISVVEVFLPLIFGASLVLGSKQLLLERGATAAAIVRHGVTVFQTGPSVWALLLEGMASAGNASAGHMSGAQSFPHLRVAITTGEATAPALAKRLVSVADLVWNLYGPTETTIWCTGQLINTPTGLDECTDVAAPVGFMWPNMPGIVVDPDGNELPDGEQGELWVGGLAVTRGYRNNPALTSERYVTREGDPDRYYRTGDLISRSPSGVLRFYGRNDDQIQVHGVRIEPMEVESAIRLDEAVEHCAATWFDSPAGGKAIVAGIVTKAGVSTDASDLHARLSTHLPSAMVPSKFVFYDHLPMTPNGKTDRIAIRTDAVASSPAVARIDEDLTATEQSLKSIWEGVLGVQHIRRADNFFAIGGDSLAAVAMVLDAQHTFGVSLAVQSALEYPVLADLASFIDRSKDRSSNIARPEVTPNQQFTFELVQGGSQRPVFFCAIELNLARKGMWRLDCPLYSVNYWTLGNGFSRAKTIEDLAASHIAEIKAIQPEGPYRIAGFSFGGIVAHEIAQQLQRSGDVIELLFLLDPTEPYRTSAAPEVLRVDDIDKERQHAHANAEHLAHRLTRHARTLLKQRSAVLSYARDKARLAPRALLQDKPVWPWIQYRMVHLHGRFPNTLTTRLLPKDRWIAFWYVARKLSQGYVAAPFRGPTVAVFINQTARRESWTPLLDASADVTEIDTSHRELVLEPALSMWMDKLEALFGGSGRGSSPTGRVKG
jgi:amino acid adenylation domain-containing protein